MKDDDARLPELFSEAVEDDDGLLGDALLPAEGGANAESPDDEAEDGPA